jgi:hypothetical protein
LGKIRDGVRIFEHLEEVGKVFANRPLDLLGLTANKVGTTLYIWVRYHSLTFAHDELKHTRGMRQHKAVCFSAEQVLWKSSRLEGAPEGILQSNAATPRLVEQH